MFLAVHAMVIICEFVKGFDMCRGKYVFDEIHLDRVLGVWVDFHFYFPIIRILLQVLLSARKYQTLLSLYF
jgi:hypothetical protein